MSRKNSLAAQILKSGKQQGNDYQKFTSHPQT